MAYLYTSGAYSSYLAKILSELVNQIEQTFLNNLESKERYLLLCVSYAKDDIILRTDCTHDCMATLSKNTKKRQDIQNPENARLFNFFANNFNPQVNAISRE